MQDRRKRVRSKQGALPALAAYRQDVAGRPLDVRSSARVGSWLAVASLLEHAGRLAPDERTATANAIDSLLQEVLSAPLLSQGPSLDPPGEQTDTTGRAIRTLAEEMEEAGALRLAHSMLGAYVAAGFAGTALDEGRCVALRARTAWKLGHLDESQLRYKAVDRLGRIHKLPELRVRAWVGFAILARIRGNYPDSRRWASRAAAAADRYGLRALAGVAVHTQLVGAAVAGDFDAALVFGWRGFCDALGDPTREAEMLVTLAQLLLDIGRPQLALRGFAAALDRQPIPRFLYPALGGAAVAAAQLHLGELVSRYATWLEDAARPGVLPYDYASAQLDVARALAFAGNHDDAETWRARAQATGVELGFHAIVHHASILAEQERSLRRHASEVPENPALRHRVLSPDALEVLDAVGALSVSADAVTV